MQQQAPSSKDFIHPVDLFSSTSTAHRAILLCNHVQQFVSKSMKLAKLGF
jgi:hypothetical protein